MEPRDPRAPSGPLGPLGPFGAFRVFAKLSTIRGYSEVKVANFFVTN